MSGWFFSLGIRCCRWTPKHLDMTLVHLAVTSGDVWNLIDIHQLIILPIQRTDSDFSANVNNLMLSLQGSKRKVIPFWLLCYNFIITLAKSEEPALSILGWVSSATAELSSRDTKFGDIVVVWRLFEWQESWTILFSNDSELKFLRKAHFI